MSRGVKKTGCRTEGSGAGVYRSQAAWKGAMSCVGMGGFADPGVGGGLDCDMELASLVCRSRECEVLRKCNTKRKIFSIDSHLDVRS